MNNRKAPETIKTWIITPRFKYHFEATLPAKRIVCPRCNGTGVHDHESFSDGLTGSEIDSMEPDVWNSYIMGDYDVTCEECHGSNVVDVLDWDKLSPKMQEAVQRAVDQQARDDAEAAYELRWCV